MDTAVTYRVPVTAIVPTANRSNVLSNTLKSLAKQNCQPTKIILVDASDNDATEQLCRQQFPGLVAEIVYQKATEKGAAVQRNQGIALVNTDVIFFFDDDIIFDPFCVERLWNCLQSGERTGGVNALVKNQHYLDPGRLTKFMYRLMSGKNLASYAGKCIGPAWNLLPADKEGMPDCNEVEWLNTTCTLYRMNALPSPVFPKRFKGYSLLEDLSLSIVVSRTHRLFNVRNARIYHDSQPGDHKNNLRELSKMELLNRHYVMTKLLGRRKFTDYCRLFIFELFGMTVVLTNKTGWKNLLPNAAGKLQAIGSLLFTKEKYE